MRQDLFCLVLKLLTGGALDTWTKATVGGHRLLRGRVSERMVAFEKRYALGPLMFTPTIVCFSTLDIAFFPCWEALHVRNAVAGIFYRMPVAARV